MPTLDDDGWSLESARERHEAYPDTFWVPPGDWLEAIGPGDEVQLLFVLRFEDEDGPAEQVERMWVDVEEVLGEGRFRGTLTSLPATEEAALTRGDAVELAAEHVMNVLFDPTGPDGWERLPGDAVPEQLVRRIVSRDEAWTLAGATGEDGELPVWSDREQAEARATGRWAGAEPERLTVDALLERLEAVEEVGLVPGPDDDGFTGPAWQLAADLRAQRSEWTSWDDERDLYVREAPEEGLTRLFVALPRGGDPDAVWPPYAAEGLWGRHLEGRRYELASVAIFAQELHHGDVVVVGRSWEHLWIDRVAERSGRLTMRVVVDDDHDPATVRRRVEEEGGTTVDGSFDRHFAIDIPAREGLADRIFELLEEADGRGELDFQTGY